MKNRRFEGPWKKVKSRFCRSLQKLYFNKILSLQVLEVRLVLLWDNVFLKIFCTKSILIWFVSTFFRSLKGYSSKNLRPVGACKISKPFCPWKKLFKKFPIQSYPFNNPFLWLRNGSAMFIILYLEIWKKFLFELKSSTSLPFLPTKAENFKIITRKKRAFSHSHL